VNHLGSDERNGHSRRLICARLTICLDTVLFLIGNPRRWSTILNERRLVSDLLCSSAFNLSDEAKLDHRIKTANAIIALCQRREAPRRQKHCPASLPPSSPLPKKPAHSNPSAPTTRARYSQPCFDFLTRASLCFTWTLSTRSESIHAHFSRPVWPTTFSGSFSPHKVPSQRVWISTSSLRVDKVVTRNPAPSLAWWHSPHICIAIASTRLYQAYA
jgi:hypothetical protein